jgi:hypothetical protein
MESARSSSVLASPFALTTEELLVPIDSGYRAPPPSPAPDQAGPRALENTKVQGGFSKQSSENTGRQNRRKGVPKAIFSSFSGEPSEDYLGFRSQFLSTIAKHRLTSKAAQEAFRQCLSGKAARTVQKVHFGTVHHLIHQCDIQFLPEGHPLIAQYQLGRARQTGKETVQEFHARIAALWGKAYPQLALDFPAAYQAFFVGLRDNRIRAHLLLQPPYSWATALYVAEYKERQLGAEKETNPLLRALLAGTFTPSMNFPSLSDTFAPPSDFPPGPPSFPR